LAVYYKKINDKILIEQAPQPSVAVFI